MTHLPPLDADPAQVFWTPGQDAGLAFLEQPGSCWRTATSARLGTWLLSDRKRVRTRWAAEWDLRQQSVLFQRPVLFEAVPAVATDLVFTGDHILVSGKWLVSGPAGDRLIGANRRFWKQRGDNAGWSRQFHDYLGLAQEGASAPAMWDGDVGGLDFVVDCQNLHNYFHFMREAFCTLTIIDRIPDFSGRVRIVGPRNDPPAFVHAYVDALFPELKGRIDFLAGPQRFDRAIIAWVGDIPGLARIDTDFADTVGPGNELANGSYKVNPARVLRGNGYSRALKDLRDRALAAVADMSFDHLPRRFWLGRRSKPGHDRTPANEGRLVERLHDRGFGTVYFEDLSPLAQIGTVHQADCMISYHGAGFTNMMFANADTEVIELGTLQTGVQRWPDFVGFAHLSECGYTVAIADFEHAGTDPIPPMRGRGLYPVRIDDPAIDKLIGHIDAL